MYRWYDDYFSGFTSGCLCVVLSHPLDTIKVRQQNIHSNLWKEVKDTYVKDGARGFYKGMLPRFLAEGPSSAAYYGTYGRVLRLIQGNTESKRTVHNDPHFYVYVFVAGCTAGVTYALVQCPAELIKTLLQMKMNDKVQSYAPPYQGITSALVGIFRSHGIFGLYRGLVPFLMREVPSSGIYPLGYEYLNVTILQEENAFFRQCISGAIAGVLAWIVVYPSDVVKSNMQADDPNNPKYRGALDCLKKIYREGGVRIFLKGFWISNLFVLVNSFAGFAIYDQVLEFMQHLREL